MSEGSAHSRPGHTARRRRGDRLAIARSRRDARQRRRSRRQAPRRRRLLGLPDRRRSAPPDALGDARPAPRVDRPRAARRSARAWSGSRRSGARRSPATTRRATRLPLLPRDRRGALRVADRGAAHRARASRSACSVSRPRAPRSFEPHDVELLADLRAAHRAGRDERALLALVAESDEEDQRSCRASSRCTGIPIARSTRPRAERERRVPRAARPRAASRSGRSTCCENPLDLGALEYEPSPRSPAQEHATCCRRSRSARRELDDIRDEVGERFGPEFSAVFNTHIQILEDKGFVAKLADGGARDRQRAAARCATCCGAYRACSSASRIRTSATACIDVEDVGRRVMAQLLGVRHQRPDARSRLDRRHRQHPARALRAARHSRRVAAIVSEHGGPTSHGAIFARTLEIPAVTGVAGHPRGAAARASSRSSTAASGIVFLRPDERLVRRVRARAAALSSSPSSTSTRCASCPAETRDGRRIALTANVGLVATCGCVEQHGAEGIGPLPHRAARARAPRLPGGGGAGAALRARRDALAPRPVTIRTLDLGGDKAMPNLGAAARGQPAARLPLDPALARAPRARSARSSARSCARAPPGTCGCCCR